MNHAVTVKKRKRSTSSILHEKKFDITKFYDLEAGCADKEDEHCSVESDNGELNYFINDNLEQVPTLSFDPVHATLQNQSKQECLPVPMDIYAFCEDEEESCDSFSHPGKNSNHIHSTP